MEMHSSHVESLLVITEKAQVEERHHFAAYEDRLVQNGKFDINLKSDSISGEERVERYATHKYIYVR